MQSRSLALALKTWANAAASTAARRVMVRQRLEQRQELRVASSWPTFDGWANEVKAGANSKATASRKVPCCTRVVFLVTLHAHRPSACAMHCSIGNSHITRILC